MLRSPVSPAPGGIRVRAAGQSAFDIFLLYAIGLLEFLMRCYDFPTAPVIIGMILGPLAEAQLRRALAISQGDWTIFLHKPLSATLFGITILLVAGPWLMRRFRKA